MRLSFHHGDEKRTNWQLGDVDGARRGVERSVKGVYRFPPMLFIWINVKHRMDPVVSTYRSRL